MKPKILIAVNRNLFPTIFSRLDLDRLAAAGHILNAFPPDDANKEFLMENISSADVVVTSWDTASLDEEVLRRGERLQLLCHAAGTVRPVVSRALWRRGIRVTSAAAAISHGVAEFCLGLILTATKRVHWFAQGARNGYWNEPRECFGGLFEIYQQNVGVIGAGHIGRRLLQLLGSFDCQRLLYDPYCTTEEAAALGARKADSLEELFSSCRVVSLNAPTNAATRHMLRGRHFDALPKGGVFVNTAGGSQIHEEEFVSSLRRGNFIACIDRCNEEPCALDHPYRQLPNVMLTPHIAGIAAENRLRIGTYVVNEIESFGNGAGLIHEVTEDALAHMA